eukprot:15365042-Ditylum_brightwellii.AAC.1
MDCFNSSYMTVEGFTSNLSGVEKVHDDPKLISLLVAVDSNIQLTVYVASHFNPEDYVCGKILFAYGIHSQTNSSGSVMSASDGAYNWNAQTCIECNYSFKDIRHDTWIVTIPKLKQDDIVGS